MARAAAPASPTFVASEAARAARAPAVSTPSLALPVDGTFQAAPNPVRLVDTRHSNSCANNQYHALKGGTSMRIEFGPTCPVTAFAEAVVVNVTVTGATTPTYVSIYPDGASRPTTSILNPVPGQTVAVLSTVALSGPNHAFDVYNASGSIQVIIDVTGFYGGPGDLPGAVFHSQQPTRAMDTRTGGGGPLPGHYFTWIGLSIPQTAAIAVNVTVTGATAPGYLTMWAGNANPSTGSSSINFTKGLTVANMAVVGTLPDSRTTSATKPPTFSILNGSTGPVHVIVDIVGWYTDDQTIGGGGTRFHPITPTRIVDSRSGLGVGSALAASVPSVVGTPSTVGDPDTDSLVASLTVIAGPAATYVSVYSGDQPAPLASSVNLAPRRVVSNLVVPGLSLNRARSFAVKASAGPTQFIVDVTGYFDTDSVRLPPTSTTTTLVVSPVLPATLAFEQPVTLTATVSTSTGDPAGGDVEFFDTDDNGVFLAAIPVAGHVATMTTRALAVGVHHFRATFAPNRWFVTSGSATTGTLTVPPTGVDAAVSDRQDAAADGNAPNTRLGRAPHLLWHAGMVGQTEALIAGGRVFFVGNDTLDALDARTGATLWEVPAASPNSRTIVYDGGVLFRQDAAGGLEARDAGTGALLWDKDSLEGFVPTTARNGVLYGVGYTSVPNSAGLQPVSEVNGMPEWSQPVNGASFVVTKSAITLQQPCGQVSSYTGSGSLVWASPAPVSCASIGNPVATFGTLFYGGRASSGTAASTVFDAATGTIEGTLTTDAMPGFDAAHTYFIRGATLTALARNGSVAWTWTCSGEGITVPVTTADTVVEGCIDGTVYFLDPATGSVVSTFAAPGGVGALGIGGATAEGPTAGDSIVVVPTGQGFFAFGP